jgi:DNA-binding transcriptional ArsR family regulator
MAKQDDVVAIAKALSHPIRIEIMEAIGDGNLSPVRFAKDHGHQAFASVSYHFTALLDFGVLTLVAQHPRRGAVEHVYAASNRGKVLQRLLADLA